MSGRNRATETLSSMSSHVIDTVLSALQENADGLSLIQAYNLVQAVNRITNAANSLIREVSRINDSPFK